MNHAHNQHTGTHDRSAQETCLQCLAHIRPWYEMIWYKRSLKRHTLHPIKLQVKPSACKPLLVSLSNR